MPALLNFDETPLAKNNFHTDYAPLRFAAQILLLNKPMCQGFLINSFSSNILFNYTALNAGLEGHYGEVVFWIQDTE